MFWKFEVGREAVVLDQVHPAVFLRPRFNVTGLQETRELEESQKSLWDWIMALKIRTKTGTMKSGNFKRGEREGDSSIDR